MGKNIGKNINKNLSGKYSAIAWSDKLLDSAKKSGLTKVTTDAFKTAWNRSIKKTAEAIGYLIRNEIADAVAKSQNVSSKSITPL